MPVVACIHTMDQERKPNSYKPGTAFQLDYDFSTEIEVVNNNFMLLLWDVWEIEKPQKKFTRGFQEAQQ